MGELKAATRRKRSYDPDGMRRRLLAVAAEAFQARGYQATSMHDVMAAAGATGGALYHHFPSKKALALEVIRERVAQAVEETWIEPVRRARNATEGILTAFDGVTSQLGARGTVSGCPLGNLALELSLADPEFRVALQRIFDEWRAALAERLRAETDDADGLATFVIATYSGAMALAKIGQSAEPLKQCRERLAGVLPRPVR